MRWIGFAFSMAAGMACGWLIGHVLGPAPRTRFDATYQSRLDRAWAEGHRAADQRVQELWQEFDRKRRPRPDIP